MQLDLAKHIVEHTILGIKKGTTGGSGDAIIISLAEITQEVPSSFIAIWEEVIGTGSIAYYISRDGKTTWQSILPNQKGVLVDFTGPDGTNIHIKAIVTGNARLYSWAVATNQEFI